MKTNKTRKFASLDPHLKIVDPTSRHQKCNGLVVPTPGRGPGFRKNLFKFVRYGRG